MRMEVGLASKFVSAAARRKQFRTWAHFFVLFFSIFYLFFVDAWSTVSWTSFWREPKATNHLFFSPNSEQVLRKKKHFISIPNQRGFPFQVIWGGCAVEGRWKSDWNIATKNQSTYSIYHMCVHLFHCQDKFQIWIFQVFFNLLGQG